MREFASSQSRAGALSLPARILYTTFAVLTLAGCASCVVLYDAIVRFQSQATPQDLFQRLSAHYLDPANRPKLVETTHAHLFALPVLLLVAGHLFLLSGLPDRAKVAGIGIACLATTLHLAAPWLIVASGANPLVGVIYPLSGALLLISFTVLLAVPVWQMWRRTA
jgi:hypothetical protein